VDVVQIDLIDAQAFQRGLASLLDPGCVAADAAASFAGAGDVGVAEL